MKARRLTVILALMLVLALGGLFAYVQSQKPWLELGVSYAARVGCGCRYIGNRPLGDCPKDFEPGMEAISLSDDLATKTVTASVFMITSRSATYHPVLGCQPVALTR
jgi:hypothetical protein